MKDLNFEIEIKNNSKIVQLLSFFDNLTLIENQLDFNAKRPILLFWKNQVVGFFLHNEPKVNNQEGTEYVRNTV